MNYRGYKLSQCHTQGFQISFGPADTFEPSQHGEIVPILSHTRVYNRSKSGLRKAIADAMESIDQTHRQAELVAATDALFADSVAR
ncbi:MAG TPA: hypothetical protein VFH85_02130 [Gammaproteobacteria bacterium]|nr:hypothetical protein [Gammaproteobacteria bacterium]